MKDQPSSTISSRSAWETLAQVYAGSRQVSADKLIEWPAQRNLAGDFRGKCVLDLGCGTGDRARYFAEEGASFAIGVDASSGYAGNWLEHANCSNLELVQGSFDALTSLPNIEAKTFDLIVLFNELHRGVEDLVGRFKEDPRHADSLGRN